jgi:hypothetical protein
MTKNSEIFFCAHKSKIYEVAKNIEIDRKMSKENDIKHNFEAYQGCGRIPCALTHRVYPSCLG